MKMPQKTSDRKKLGADFNVKPVASAPRNKNISFEEDISVHIFTASATLLGICLTVIGIIRIFIIGQHINTLADDFLAVDSILFMTSCFLAYWALRARTIRRMHRIERFADVIFLIGLFVLMLTCITISYAIF